MLHCQHKEYQRTPANMLSSVLSQVISISLYACSRKIPFATTVRINHAPIFPFHIVLTKLK